MIAHKIELVGINGDTITLADPAQARREGVALREVPDNFSGFPTNHVWESGWAQQGGLWRGTQGSNESLQLDVQVKNTRRPRYWVNRLLDALGDGRRVALLRVTVDGKPCTLSVRMQEASNVDWGEGQTALTSVHAQFSIRLAVPRPLWQLPRESVTLTKASTFGIIPLPTAGDTPIWPTFTVTGTHKGVKLRLTATDTEQVLPANTGGWVVETQPERRGIRTVAGAYDFAGVVPFWPEPVEVQGGRGEVRVTPESPGSDFKLVIDWIPEARRAW